MISAAGIPVIETDVDALNGHAAALGAAGSDFAAAGADLHTTWQGLTAFYRAPEAGYLFASTGPVRDTTRSVGEDVELVGSARLERLVDLLVGGLERPLLQHLQLETEVGGRCRSVGSATCVRGRPPAVIKAQTS